MVQLIRKKNLTLDQSKVGTDIGTARLVVDLRIPARIITIPWMIKCLYPRMLNVQVDIIGKSLALKNSSD